MLPWPPPPPQARMDAAVSAAESAPFLHALPADLPARGTEMLRDGVAPPLLLAADCRPPLALGVEKAGVDGAPLEVEAPGPPGVSSAALSAGFLPLPPFFPRAGVELVARACLRPPLMNPPSPNRLFPNTTRARPAAEE